MNLTRLTCLGLFLFSSSLLFAQSSLQLFFFKKDLVQYKRRGSKAYQKVVRKMSLQTGDSIKTLSKGLAILHFPSGSKIKIEPETELQIQKLDLPKRQTSLLLKAGAVFTQIKPNTTPKTQFRLQTKAVSMGVRGTQFFATFSQQAPGKAQDLWMCVKEGLVEVISRNSNKKVIVKAGEGIMLKKAREITDPRAYAWTKKLNWNMDHKKDLTNQVDLSKAYYEQLNMDYD